VSPLMGMAPRSWVPHNVDCPELARICIGDSYYIH
jgi:hypothetical protein